MGSPSRDPGAAPESTPYPKYSTSTLASNDHSLFSWGSESIDKHTPLNYKKLSTYRTFSKRINRRLWREEVNDWYLIATSE
jgi:hypothetical protein